MTWLRQSTAVTVKVGPFVDDTDGKTAETTLTISQADIRLSKNGGAYAQTNNAAGATHDEKGEYGVPLDTTDTGTLGTLKVHIQEAGALPVWAEFMVVPANVWDALFGADKLQVHVDEMTAGIITAAVIDADAITDAKVASDVTIASVTGAVGSVAGAVGSVTGNVGGNVVGSVASVTAKVTPIDVDGLTFAKAMEVLLAVLAGKAVPAGSDVAFLKRDGVTTTITITYGAADGERTASVIT